MTSQSESQLNTPATSSLVRVRECVLFQVLQDETVLLHLDSGTYFGLDPVGTRIWQLIGEGSTLSAVIRTVTAEFEVGEEQCTADVLSLAASLAQHDLVTIETPAA